MNPPTVINYRRVEGGTNKVHGVFIYLFITWCAGWGIHSDGGVGYTVHGKA